MYYVSAQGVDERMIDVHYYYYSVCNSMHQYRGAHEKSQTLAAIPLFGRKKILHRLVAGPNLVDRKGRFLKRQG